MMLKNVSCASFCDSSDQKNSIKRLMKYIRTIAYSLQNPKFAKMWPKTVKERFCMAPC